MELTIKDFKYPGTSFDKFTTPQTFSCWKIRFKSEVRSCSNFFTGAMLWIKDVEMATSVGGFKSSRFIQGITPCQDFESLDARIASSLNKIIQNSYFKKWRQKCSCFVDRDKEFGLCISGREAVKIVIDFTEVLNDDETNPLCQIYFTSTAQRQTSRSKSVAQKNLP